jgi:hypothetical protein
MVLKIDIGIEDTYAHWLQVVLWAAQEVLCSPKPLESTDCSFEQRV